MAGVLHNICRFVRSGYYIATFSVLFVIVQQGILVTCQEEDEFEFDDFDGGKWKCEYDAECELIADYRDDEKKECCDDGKCREHCLSVGLVILLFVVLPCCGCCVLVAVIAAVVYCIVKSGNKESKVQVHNGVGVAPVPYNGAYPHPPACQGSQPPYAAPYPTPPTYMPPAQPTTMY